MVEYTLTRKRIKRINLRVKGDGSVHVSAPINTPQTAIDAFVASCEDMIAKARAKFATHVEARKQLYPRLQYVEGEQILILGKLVPIHVEEVVSKQAERAWFNGESVTIYTRSGHTVESRKQLVDNMWRLYATRVFGRVLKEVQEAFFKSPYGIRNKEQVTMKEYRVRDMKSRWGSCMPQRAIITLSTRLLSFDRKYIEYVAVHEFAHLVEANHSPRFHRVVENFLPHWQVLKAELNQQGALVYGN